MSFRRVNKVQPEVEESLLPSFFALSSRTGVEFALVVVLPAHRSRL
jgi:hypothetical protein